MVGRVRTYESIVKGHNVPKPGVPESFKVLMKELQALCLDVRVLDRDGEEVELKDEEEDGFTPDRRPNQDFDYASDEGEFAAHGFTTGRMEADGNVVADFEEGALFIDESSKDESTDNED